MELRLMLQRFITSEKESIRGNKRGSRFVPSTMYNVPSILSALYTEIRVPYEFPLLNSALGVQYSTLKKKRETRYKIADV